MKEETQTQICVLQRKKQLNDSVDEDDKTLICGRCGDNDCHCLTSVCNTCIDIEIEKLCSTS